MRIYNTLSHTVEEFKPASDEEVTMYTCGPTVYNHMHIGNLRTFVFSDLLLRVLKFNNYKVKSAQNITDIDDKIIKKAEEKQTTIEVVGEEYTKYFLSDVGKLNIEEPTFRPKATEYIEKMVDYIKALLENGFAYKEEDGSVYFDISKFEDYGKLSGVSDRELKSGTRNLSDEYTKDNVQDFALWKAEKEESLGAFKTDLGWGRPGWHIECSVMSQTLLGEKIDIHAGGIDLVFPHHENEIAQSEAKTGQKPFVKYWVHGAHMLVDDKKMSKSLNNFFTLSDLEKRSIDPLALRYLYLQTHYRQEMNFTWEALQAAQTVLNRLRQRVLDMKNNPEGKLGAISIEEKYVSYEIRFKDAVNDDLNMPMALGVLWTLVDNGNVINKQKLEFLTKFDEVLGLGLSEFKEKEIPQEVQKLLDEREELRKQKRFDLADQIRERIIKMGYRVEDKN